MGGMAAAVQLQEMNPDAVAQKHRPHFRAALPVLAVVSPRAHHELRFLRRFQDRRVVSSSYRILHDL